RTFLGAPPTPRFGVSEAKLQTPGAENAPRERDGLFEKRMRLRRRPTLSRVPDAVQRITKWGHKRVDARLRRAMAPLIRDRHRLERSTQVGFTRLAHFKRRSRVNPRSVSAAHHFVLRCARDTESAAIQHSCATAGRANNQPVAVGNERRLRSLVSGLLFTMNGATPTCRAVGARRRHPRQDALSARGAP